MPWAETGLLFKVSPSLIGLQRKFAGIPTQSILSSFADEGSSKQRLWVQKVPHHSTDDQRQTINRVDPGQLSVDGGQRRADGRFEKP